MKLFKTKRGYKHISLRGLLRVIVSWLCIPIHYIMFTLIKPKTYFDYLERGNIFGIIRETLALQLKPNFNIKNTWYRCPYIFGTVYKENPNTIYYDNNIPSPKIVDIKEYLTSTKEYIKGVISYTKGYFKLGKYYFIGSGRPIIYEDR